MKQPTLCVDFDAVIAQYDSFKGKGKFGEPIEGAKQYITRLAMDGWRIIIHTTRSETDQIIKYLEKHEIPYDYINHNPVNYELGCNPGKPMADVYLDDRAITFDGDWEATYLKIQNFREWWK